MCHVADAGERRPFEDPVHYESLLPGTIEAGALIRGELDGWLNAQVGEHVGDDVRLATTELVSNVVRHGDLRPDDGIAVRVDTKSDVVRVVVEQASSAAAAEMTAPYAGGGYGLRIIDAVADRWGVEDGPPGRVWFEIACSPA